MGLVCEFLLKDNIDFLWLGFLQNLSLAADEAAVCELDGERHLYHFKSGQENSG